MPRRLLLCSLLVLAAVSTSGCFLRLLLGAETVETLTEEIDLVITAVSANATTAVCRPSPFTGLLECTYVFEDPDGFLAEPAYDLGVVLRDWCTELLAARDARELATAAVLREEADEVAHAPEVGGEPVHNEAALRQREESEDQPARFFDHTLSHGNCAATQRTHLSSAFFIFARFAG